MVKDNERSSKVIQVAHSLINHVISFFPCLHVQFLLCLIFRLPYVYLFLAFMLLIVSWFDEMFVLVKVVLGVLDCDKSED